MKFFDDKITAEQRSSVDALRLPDVTYTQGVTLYLGGSREVLLRAFPGHTGGDTVVYDPESNVVFCGDLFWNRTLPNLIDVSTREWIETLDTLVKDYPSATFVPGHGDNAGKAGDVQTFRDYLLFLRAGIAKAQAEEQQRCCAEGSAAPGKSEVRRLGIPGIRRARHSGDG